MRKVFVGYDPREAEAFAVCVQSIKRHAWDMPVYGICLDEVEAAGLYWRALEKRNGQLWDTISEAPMSTQFAISRFLTPHLAGGGWALFMDCDMMLRTDINELFDAADPRYAVMCVKHKHEPCTTIKMDGQLQTLYARKNWSSVMLFNCDHPSNKKLTVDLINTVPGRDLHRFCWLEDDEIGALDPAWNFLVGHSDPSINPKLVHWTEGGPWFENYRDVPFADEYWQVRSEWLADGPARVRPLTDAEIIAAAKLAQEKPGALSFDEIRERALRDRAKGNGALMGAA